MKEKDKLNFLTLLKKHISYKDGFWVYNDDNKELVISEQQLREYIRGQGVPILEKDITDLLSELSYYNSTFDVDEYFKNLIKSRAGNGKSKYFESLDKLYPGNKFRQLMNYYLFSVFSSLHRARPH